MSIISTTVQITISGSTSSELISAAEKVLSEFFELSVDEVNEKISYEILAQEQTEIVDFDDEELYTAKVIAKVKHDRTRTVRDYSSTSSN